LASDRDLITRCLAGKSSAFDGIVLRYQDALFRHLRRLTGDNEQASDLCQEAFIKFYRALSSFDCNRTVAPFLFKIATNLWRDGKANDYTFTSLDSEEVTDQRLLEEEVLKRLEHQSILLAMKNLRWEYREIISLRYDQGFSYREIGEIMGLSDGTVATWVRRATDELRVMLTNQANTEGIR